MANRDLYERYAQPPENALKSFNNGKFSGTDINPMWRIKALTEAFGPCGIGWYTEVIRQWREDTNDGSATVYCHIHLYIKVDGEWSKPITGIGGNTLSRKTKSGSSTTDEAYKMAYTDAMGIACKALGIGADIWWKEARSKYTANDVSGSQPTISTGDKVPPRSYDYKTPLNDLLSRMHASMEDFARMRQALIDVGILPAMKSSEMGEADWKRVFDAIWKSFGPDEGVA